MKAAVCLCLCGIVLMAAEPAKEIFEKAAQALSAGDYAAAERGFQAVLRQEPNQIAALANLGVIYSRTNRADQAIAAYQKALRLSPDDKPILLNLGLVYLKQEAHARALPYFERVVKLDPGNLQARQLLAVSRAYTGQVRPAIQELEALHQSAPHDENILFLLGFCYLKDRNPERAKLIFQQMFDSAGPSRAQFLLGRADYEATQFSEAESAFREVLRIDPKFPGVHLELGKVYISLRRNDDALRELNLALQERPGDPDASYFLGGLLVQQGRDGEGIPYLERAKDAKPDFWAPYFYLGKARLRMEHPAEAVAFLERAVQLNPDDASAFYDLSRALQASGRTEEARDAMVRVRELRDAALKAQAPPEPPVAGAR
jgi:tetratricopeptide (TPR) repeat protein